MTLLPALPSPSTVTTAELGRLGSELVAWSATVNNVAQVRDISRRRTEETPEC